MNVQVEVITVMPTQSVLKQMEVLTALVRKDIVAMALAVMVNIAFSFDKG